jgi:hypothetical protein
MGDRDPVSLHDSGPRFHAVSMQSLRFASDQVATGECFAECGFNSHMSDPSLARGQVRVQRVAHPASALAFATEAMMPTKSRTGRRTGARRKSSSRGTSTRARSTGRKTGSSRTRRKATTVREAGSRGGRRTLERKGSAFYREIGAKGGRAGGSRGGKKGGARVRALVAAGKRASRRTTKSRR